MVGGFLEGGGNVNLLSLSLPCAQFARDVGLTSHTVNITPKLASTQCVAECTLQRREERRGPSSRARTS